eukprot:8232954-Lingulodinium_polyedra.AAC.1
MAMGRRGDSLDVDREWPGHGQLMGGVLHESSKSKARSLEIEKPSLSYGARARSARIAECVAL